MLRQGELATLKAALAKLPRSGGSLTRGNPPPGGTQFLIRYQGRTLHRPPGCDVPGPGPPIRILDGLINGVGIDETTRERATHTY